MEKQQTHHIDILANDLYQFTCSYSYFCSGKHESEATFEIFFRKYPFGGEYTIFAGLESVRQFINTFKLTKEHEEFLKQTLPQLSEQYFQWLRQDFRDKIKVKAFTEGSIVFAREPLISYTGPLGFVQILQTPLLNLLGFASLVATNASRMVKAIHPKKCVQFGLRRAQGPDGGFSASAYAFLGGFSGTSNVKASQVYKIPCFGTMSHAFITSFTNIEQLNNVNIQSVDIVKRALQIRKQFGWKTHDGQLASFLAYCKCFSSNFKALIDTYSTLQSGMLNFIIVSKVLIELGIGNVGIRLDSGDLCQLSKECRKIWNKFMPGHNFLILASDDLHEDRLLEMEKNQSQIDVYAIGTHIATCKKQPALGLVCKLTEICKIPKMKFSSDGQKSTLPGNKIIYRVWTDKSNRASFDLFSLEGEEILLGQNKLYNLHKEHQEIHIIIKLQQMNQPLDIYNFSHTLVESKQFLQKSKGDLPSAVFELHKPQKYPLLLTHKFLQMLHQTRKNNQLEK